MSGTWGEWRFATSKLDVLQLSKSSKRAMGRVDRAPSHAATSNSCYGNEHHLLTCLHQRDHPLS